MAVIRNLQTLHAALAAVAPIDGVAGDGKVFFQPSATPAQMAAANAVVAAFVDVPPQMVDIATVLSRLTPAEYALLAAKANTDPITHRFFFAQRNVDLAAPGVAAFISGLTAAAILTQARASALFVASAAPTPPTIQIPAQASVSVLGS